MHKPSKMISLILKTGNPIGQWNLTPTNVKSLESAAKKHPVIFPYKLHGIELKTTEAAKYLGVTISKDLSWTNHINNISSKASNSLRFIKTNIKTSNKKVKETAYKT